jgi:hypothetical protein
MQSPLTVRTLSPLKRRQEPLARVRSELEREQFVLIPFICRMLCTRALHNHQGCHSDESTIDENECMLT